MSQLNDEIRNAIDSFDTDKARQLLRDALKQADAETYYLASLVAVDDDQKLSFLNKAIAEDPFHEKALKALKQTTDNANKVVIPTPAQVNTPPTPLPVNTSDIILPMATVAPTSTGVVYTIPHPKGTQRTALPLGTSVELIGRTPLNNWMNITFITSIGQRAFGWIPSTDLVNFNFMGNRATPSDLPISEFNFNTKSEMQELIGRTQQKAILLGIGIWLILMGGFFGIFGVFLELTVGLYVAIGMIFLGILLIPSGRRNSNYHGFTAVQMQNALRAKKSDTELLMEHQSNMMLMNIAGNMATRMVPNKQDVTVRYR